jgi:hypothetical protein
LIETIVQQKNEGVDVSMFAVPWFHTLFARNSQLSFVFRLWDIFLNEGISIIFRVALAILRESQGSLTMYSFHPLSLSLTHSLSFFLSLFLFIFLLVETFLIEFNCFVGLFDDRYFVENGSN